MATANFTTKPPMLDGSCREMGFNTLGVLGPVDEKFRVVACVDLLLVKVDSQEAGIRGRFADRERGGKILSETQVGADGNLSSQPASWFPGNSPAGKKSRCHLFLLLQLT